jgi:hypothetical protein
MGTSAGGRVALADGTADAGSGLADAIREAIMSLANGSATWDVTFIMVGTCVSMLVYAALANGQ